VTGSLNRRHVRTPFITTLSPRPGYNLAGLPLCNRLLNDSCQIHINRCNFPLNVLRYDPIPTQAQAGSVTLPSPPCPSVVVWTSCGLNTFELRIDLSSSSLPLQVLFTTESALAYPASDLVFCGLSKLAKHVPNTECCSSCTCSRRAL